MNGVPGSIAVVISYQFRCIGDQRVVYITESSPATKFCITWWNDNWFTICPAVVGRPESWPPSGRNSATLDVRGEAITKLCKFVTTIDYSVAMVT